MFNEFGINYVGLGISNPAFPVFVGFGYDPDSYISTAQLAPSPYVTQAAIQARIGGLAKLIESVDDSQPPIQSLAQNNPPNNPAYTALQAVIQNVTTEINGYLSSIYPIPLAQTGTVAVIGVLTVDPLGGITGIKVLDAGNYCTAPAAANSPAYLRHSDPAATKSFGAATGSIGRPGPEQFLPSPLEMSPTRMRVARFCRRKPSLERLSSLRRGQTTTPGICLF